MKKAFSLIEVVIGIAIFSIIVVVLMQSVQSLKNSNTTHLAKAEELEQSARFQKIIFLDLIGAKHNETKIIQHKAINILTFVSNNTYHDPFKNHIVYILSKQSNLLRLECSKALEINDTFDPYRYFDTCHVDVLKSDIAVFEPIKIEKSKQINLFFKSNDGKINSFGVTQIY